MTVQTNGKINKKIYEYQTPVTLNQVSPVQNTYYTVLDVTGGVHVYGYDINVEDTNETLESRITIDGSTISDITRACTHSTGYSYRRAPDPVNLIDQVYPDGVPDVNFRSILFEGVAIKIELRKTTAAGTGNLTAMVQYSILTNKT